MKKTMHSLYSSSSRKNSKNGSTRQLREAPQPQRSTSKKYQSHQQKMEEETSHKQKKATAVQKQKQTISEDTGRKAVRQINKQFETFNIQKSLEKQKEEKKSQKESTKKREQKDQQFEEKSGIQQKQIKSNEQQEQKGTNSGDSKFPQLITESEQAQTQEALPPQKGLGHRQNRFSKNKENNPFYGNAQIEVKRKNIELAHHPSNSFSVPESYLLALKVLQEKVQSQKQTIDHLSLELNQKQFKLKETDEKCSVLSLSLSETRQLLQEREKQIKFLKGYLHETTVNNQIQKSAIKEVYQADAKKLLAENSNQKLKLIKQGSPVEPFIIEEGIKSMRQETFGHENNECMGTDDQVEYLHEKQQKLLQQREELNQMEAEIINNRQLLEEHERAVELSELRKRSASLNNLRRSTSMKNQQTPSKKRLSHVPHQRKTQAQTDHKASRYSKHQPHTANIEALNPQNRPKYNLPEYAYVEDPVILKIQEEREAVSAGIGKSIQKKLSSNREAVSKMRELMRNERELVAMNYKLEAIQKNISAQLSLGIESRTSLAKGNKSDSKQVHSAVEGLKRQYLIVKNDIHAKEVGIKQLKIKMEKEEKMGSIDKSHSSFIKRNQNTGFKFDATPKQLFQVEKGEGKAEQESQ